LLELLASSKTKILNIAIYVNIFLIWKHINLNFDHERKSAFFSYHTSKYFLYKISLIFVCNFGLSDNKF